MHATSVGTLSPVERAIRSAGISAVAIYKMVARALDKRGIRGGRILDFGCGVGNLYGFVRSRFDEYIGVDIVRYEGFPEEAQFVPVDLNSSSMEHLEGDVVVAVETIEHLENPRDFMRQIVGAAKPGAWVAVTTPNQLSFLSLLTLVVKHRFAAFQDAHYPAHLTALLEIDLLRIARENGLTDVAIEYSESGRIVLTPLSYPGFLARLFPRLCSDNLMVIGRKPV